MTATRPVPLICIDDLAQVRDELRVLWVALGNDDDADDHRTEIREHVYALGERVAKAVGAMSSADKAEQERLGRKAVRE